MPRVASKNAPKRKSFKKKASKVQAITPYRNMSETPCMSSRTRGKEAGNKIYKISRNVPVFAVLTSNAAAGATKFAAFAFGTGNLPSFTDIAQMYDEYRIDEIELWVVSHQNAIPSVTNIGTGGYLALAIDLTDVITPTANVVEGYENCVILSPQQNHYIKWKPTCAIATASAINVPTYDQEKVEVSPWLATTSTNAQHFGLKYAQQATTGAVAAVWTLRACYHMSLRTAR